MLQEIKTGNDRPLIYKANSFDFRPPLVSAVASSGLTIKIEFGFNIDIKIVHQKHEKWTFYSRKRTFL